MSAHKTAILRVVGLIVLLTWLPAGAAASWDPTPNGPIPEAQPEVLPQSQVLNLHLDLPTGSRIDYLRMFYYDTSPHDSTAWVTTYNGAGGITDLTNVSSSGTAGYG